MSDAAINKPRIALLGVPIEIGAAQTITVGKSRTAKIKEDDTTEVGRHRALKVQGNSAVAVDKDYALTAKKISIRAEDELSIKVGSAELVMKKNGDITLDGKKIQIKGSGDIVIKGSKVTTN